MLKPVCNLEKLNVLAQLLLRNIGQILKKIELYKEDFQKIDVSEPTIDEAYKIMFGLRGKYEEYHKVKYSDDAIKASVDLSAKYIGNKRLPDKSIDILDELGAFENLKEKQR